MPSPADHILADETLASVLPSTFAYGCASASYQIEGHITADGKGPNVWDVILKDKADNGEDACNSYEQWRDDVALLKRYGCNTYRFSIGWARIFPDGTAGTLSLIFELTRQATARRLPMRPASGITRTSATRY
jgi:hypothetical protein